MRALQILSFYSTEVAARNVAGRKERAAVKNNARVVQSRELHEE
jgi:hypothetical protein